MCSRKFERRGRVGLSVVLGLTVLSLVVAPMLGAAEVYPSKPITLVVGMAPGGSVGITAEIFREVGKNYLPKAQPILIDYKPGAAQAIAADFVFKQPADGYNLLWAEISLMVKIAKDGNLLSFKMEDFTFIGSMAPGPPIFAVNKESPFKKLVDFLDYAKKNPGKLSFGHSGVGSGSHFNYEVIRRGCGIELNPIPFAGGAPITTAILGGHIDCATFASATLGDHIKPGGGLRALATLSPERWGEMPDLPTFLEKGYNVVYAAVHFLAAPKGTPQPVLDILRNVFEKTANDPRAKEAAIRAKLIPKYQGPEEFEKEAKKVFEFAKEVYK